MKKTEFLKIGVSGGGYDGNFSEKAANYFFNKNNINFKLVCLIGVKEVIKACIEGKIDKGIFPMETPVGGINEAVYAMSKYIFNIEDIFKFDGRSCLLVGPVFESAPVRQITK